MLTHAEPRRPARIIPYMTPRARFWTASAVVPLVPAAVALALLVLLNADRRMMQLVLPASLASAYVLMVVAGWPAWFILGRLRRRTPFFTLVAGVLAAWVSPAVMIFWLLPPLYAGLLEFWIVLFSVTGAICGWLFHRIAIGRGVAGGQRLEAPLPR